MVVPEIEMPSHAGAAARSYPELFNRTAAHSIRRTPRLTTSSEAVFTEVARLFPAPYIHFGGDEVGDDTWKDMTDVDRAQGRDRA